MSEVIHVSALHGVFAFCEAHNLDQDAILKSAGILESIDPFSANYLTVQVFYDLIIELKKASGFEHIPLLSGMNYMRTLGPLGQIIASADSLGEAWHASVRYLPIYSPNFRWTMTPSPPYLQLDFKALFQLEHGLEEITALALAQLYSVYREITGNKWSPKEIHFINPAPKDLKPYNAFFNTTLVFDAEFDGMWLSESDMNIRLPGANLHLHATLCQYAETQLKESSSDETLQLVRAHIKHGLPERRHALPMVAASLKMSPRSLQRRLQEQGYKYEELLVEVRMQLSKQHLQVGNLQITQIAQYVGYQNVSAFSNAFNKHFGMTPRQCRNIHGSSNKPI